MTRLSELVHSADGGWNGAACDVRPPTVDAYNIAADCLAHPGGDTALIVADNEGNRAVSFAELDDQASRMASALSGLGVRRGDRVAVRMSQSLEMAVAVLGTLHAGAVVVPISTLLGDDAVRHRLGDSSARVLVCTGDDGEIAAALDAGAVPVTVEDAGHLRLDEALSAARPATPAATSGDTAGVLLYTSGTEGKSKGVLHGHRVIPGHYTLGFAFDGVRPNDVAYSPVDWAWGGGLLLGLLAPLAYGMPVVAYRQPGFDPERALGLMRETGVSVGLFPPTVLRMLRAALGDRAAAPGLRLRCLVSGAESVEADLVPWAKEALGATVNNAYGQTEANALVGHSTSLGTLDPAALGRPYPGRRIAVLGEDLQPVARGEQGQLAVDADDPVCMIRYWGQPGPTAAKFRDGWLLTGDTVHADGGGTLFFHGRNDDIIKASGYRIGPAEVEAAVLKHPRVVDCAVVGVPDAVRGGAVAAFVRLDGGPPAPAEVGSLVKALQLEVRARVGAHAYPRHVEFVDELPRTPTGKVDRRRLRDQVTRPQQEAIHE